VAPQSAKYGIVAAQLGQDVRGRRSAASTPPPQSQRLLAVEPARAFPGTIHRMIVHHHLQLRQHPPDERAVRSVRQPIVHIAPRDRRGISDRELQRARRAQVPSDPAPALRARAVCRKRVTAARGERTASDTESGSIAKRRR
jgi:hypothetical protein